MAAAQSRRPTGAPPARPARRSRARHEPHPRRGCHPRGPPDRRQLCRRARRHDRTRDLLDPHHDPLQLLPARRRHLPRPRRRHRRGRSPSTAPRSTRPSTTPTAASRLPGLAVDNELVVNATGRYTNTGEGLHRFVDPVDDEVYLYSQFEVPDCRRMYPVFEQPDLKAALHLHGHRAGPLAGRLQLADARARAPAGRRRRDVALRPDAAHLELHHRPRRRPLRRGPRRRHEPPRRGAARHLLPPVAHPAPRRRQPLRLHEAGFRLLREGVRPALPLREVRPDLHARVQHGRDGERRLRHLQRGLRLPRPRSPRPSSSAAP